MPKMVELKYQQFLHGFDSKHLFMAYVTSK